MEIKTYNSEQLHALILSDEFKRMPVIPISTHRAISHIRNPRAEADDVLLLIAYDNGKMAGYLGVLADRIYNTKGEGYKCGWLSCMWVDPQVRGKGIAKQLLANAFKSWNDHILVTEFTPEAKGLYDRSGNFNDLRTSEGLRCYMRFNLHEVLPKKSERYKLIAPLLRMSDGLANVFNDLLLAYRGYNRPLSLRYEQVKRVDVYLEDYICSKSLNSFEKRQRLELNWVAEYPWLIQSAPTGESIRYHFSSVAEKFENSYVKILDGNKIVGFMQLTIRDGHLKVPYAYFEKGILPDVMEYIYSVMLSKQLSMLTVFHKEIVEYLSSHGTLFIYIRKIKRQYIITKVLDDHFADKKDLIIQDGDADCAFT